MCNGGVTLACVEDNLAGPRPHQKLQGYTLDTHTEFTVLETADRNAIGSIGVDKGVLYYSDSTSGHAGIYARTFATRQELRVQSTPIGSDLVVKDGVMLWSAVRRSGGPNPPDETLHMLKLDSSLGDTIITREQSDFSGYVLSGDAADPRAPFAYCRCSQALRCVQQGYAGRGCGAHGVQISTGQQRRIDSVGC